MLIIYLSFFYLFSDSSPELRQTLFSSPVEKKRQETIEHKHRLRIGAISLLERFPKEFTLLDKTLIREYLALHDMPKIMPLEDLRLLGYKGYRTIAERLAYFDGKRKDQMSDSDRNQLNRTIRELNELEDRLKASFFEGKNLSVEQIQQLKRLERLVDLTDTSVFRGREIGGKVGSKKVRDFLGAEMKWQDGEMVDWLEKNYKTVVKLNPIAQTTKKASFALRDRRKVKAKTILRGSISALIATILVGEMLEQDLSDVSHLPEDFHPVMKPQTTEASQ